MHGTVNIKVREIVCGQYSIVFLAGKGDEGIERNKTRILCPFALLHKLPVLNNINS